MTTLETITTEELDSISGGGDLKSSLQTAHAYGKAGVLPGAGLGAVIGGGVTLVPFGAVPGAVVGAGFGYGVGAAIGFGKGRNR